MDAMERGPERTRHCGARCAEVMRSIRYVHGVLQETEQAVGREAGPQGSERELCIGRLEWAYDMVTGLQQGTRALKIMELADLLSEGGHLDSSATGAHAQMQEECRKTVEAQYRCLERQIGDCKEQIADISRRLAAKTLASKPTKARREAATTGEATPYSEACEIYEGIEEMLSSTASAIGSMLWPFENLLKFIRPAVVDVMWSLQQCKYPAKSNLLQLTPFSPTRSFATPPTRRRSISNA